MTQTAKRISTFLKIAFVGYFLWLVSFIAFAGYYNQQLCHQAGYRCVRIQKGQSWASLFPDLKERQLVMRLNRMNTELYPGLTIAIPDQIHRLTTEAIAPLPQRLEPQGREVLIVNLRAQAFGAYDRYGYLVYWGPISGGQSWCPDVGRSCRTPTGQFFIYAKRGPECISSKYPIGEGGAPMPFCMFFYKGYAMHGSFLPGYHASHGCIRLFPEDAEWLNQNFVEAGRGGTKVMIQSFNDLRLKYLQEKALHLSYVLERTMG